MRKLLPLLGILGLGLLLRARGLAFGLPHVQARPDEIALVSVAMDFLEGRFWPPFYDYPRLVPYVFAAAYAVYAGIGQVAGWFHAFGDFTSSWKQWWPPLFLLGRWVSVISGTLTIAVSYRLGADAFTRRAGLIGAFFLAGSLLAVRESHYATTDALMTLLCWSALALLVRAHETGRRALLWAGTLLAALAVSTKYSAAPLGLSVTAVLVLFRRDGRMSTRDAVRHVLLLGAAGAIVFLAVNPYIVFDWERFRAAIDVLAASYGSGMKTPVPLPPGWIYHVTVSLWYGLGWPVLLAGLAGLAVAAWQRPTVALIVGVFAVAFYVAIGRSSLLFVRYALPLVPAVCLGAGVAVDAVVSRVATRRRLPVAAAVSLMLAVPSLVATARFDTLLARPDSRGLAAEWIGAHVPSGSRIAQSGSEYGRVHLPWGHAYHLWSFHPRFNAFVEGRWDPVTGTPDYIIVQESPLPYSYVVPQMQQMLNDDYGLVHAIRAVRMDQQSANVYDLQDAFFLPYAGFKGVSRPGPNLYIWQRRVSR